MLEQYLTCHLTFHRYVDFLHEEHCSTSVRKFSNKNDMFYFSPFVLFVGQNLS